MKNLKNTPPSCLSAFTLIELLTVIAVIAVLAGILIPVVGKVRENAHIATSVSNLRQMGTGMNLLIQEGAPVTGKGRYPAYAGLDWPRRFSWFHLIGEQLEFVNWDDGQSEYVWLVEPSKSIFQHPGYDVDFDVSDNAVMRATASYSYNEEGLGSLWANAGQDVPVSSLPPTPLNIVNPANFIIISESDRSGKNDHAVHSDWDSYGLPDYNNGGGNYLFADGHVGWLEKEATLADSAKYFKRTGR